MKKKALYLIEFGDPDSGFSFLSGKDENLFVIADSYEQAIAKAQAYKEFGKKENIFDGDGSLKADLYTEKPIKSVKLISKEILT